MIGVGVGVAVGMYFGGPAGAATGLAEGAIIGHGLDRVITRIANDITGPNWKNFERGVNHAGGQLSQEWKKVWNI